VKIIKTYFMKTILIILVSVTLSLGVAAQHRVYYHSYHPRVYIAPYSYGFGFGYPAFGYPYFGYPYYGYPFDYPYYGYRPMPYKLSLQIQSIKDDYRNKIRDARKDKSVSRSERRKEIRYLKAERDQDVINAQRNFSRSGRRNNQKPGSNYQNQNNNNSSSGDNSYNGGTGS
jgi:hypothetical protein